MQAWLIAYRDPKAHWDLYQLGEELTDLEDMFRLWRFRHVTTVERVIGFKRGTGGTGGVSYLRKMLDVVLFPEIEFDEKKFLARVDRLVKEHGYCTVVVSEGCHYPDGRFLAATDRGLSVCVLDTSVATTGPSSSSARSMVSARYGGPRMSGSPRTSSLPSAVMG